MVQYLFLVISECGFLHLLEPVSLIFGGLKHENFLFAKKVSNVVTLQGMPTTGYRLTSVWQRALWHLERTTWKLKKEKRGTWNSYPHTKFIKFVFFPRHIDFGRDLAEWLERRFDPASSETVVSEGWQMKPCWITYVKRKNPRNSPLKLWWLFWVFWDRVRIRNADSNSPI